LSARILCCLLLLSAPLGACQEPPPKPAPSAADAKPDKEAPKPSLDELGFDEEYWGEAGGDDWESPCMGGDSPEQAHALIEDEQWLTWMKKPVRACSLYPGIMVVRVQEGKTLRVAYEPLNPKSSVSLVVASYQGEALGKDVRRDGPVEVKALAPKTGLYHIILHSKLHGSVGMFTLEVL
jgi:hypothetical protein